MKFQLNCLLTYNKYRNVVFRTYAGHSKWQNIKHIKMENDTAKSLLFNRLTNKMKAVVAETKISNPSENSKLAQLVDQAKKANMPAATLNKVLEKLQKNENHKIEVLPVRGPELSTLNVFDCASYIIALKDCTLDEATDDAILINAHDVEEVQYDDKTYFKFKCEFLSSEKSITQLINKNYSVIEIEDTCIPMTEVELNEEELKEVNKLKDKLSLLTEIVKIEDNIFVP
ncbi:translational activator of cytochrome c oxidase 1 isoform X2 [Ptiloglossa arizonensis]|uniref:translational activator of cytochrome c oxidase 1 isoform X2 n=1 Tax=Ptiloglossa arizonensis TaxID=3350558 RepID=UPI003F9F15D6